MLRSAVVLLLLVAELQGTAGILAVAPNPVAPNDRGEHVVLEFPEETDLSNWSLRDDQSRATFPNVTVRGRVVATTDPDAVANTTDDRVVELSGRFALANDGETIQLLRGGDVVDRVRYRSAPEGEHLVRTDGGWEWRHPGGTDRSVAAAASADARLFVLPDAPREAVTALQSARDRILLAGYTFGSRRIASALCAARERGVRVRVLLERSPVGGFTGRSAELLDDIVACGVDVAVIGGERSRYAFHHAKYAVVDDRALVLTENWVPAGTGGRSSRGWGIQVDSASVATSLAEIFEADAGWRDATDWEVARDRMDFVAGDPPPGERFPSRFDPSSARVDGIEIVVAPDNAEEHLVEVLDGADDSIRVQQLSIGSRGLPFVRALLRAAERGVTVRVLLSGEWYVREENAAIVNWLNERGSRAGLPIEARLAEPRSRYGKIHAKGVVVDGETTILGSVNWNNASIRDNREVAVVVHGAAAGEYYARVFRADWRGGTWRLPIGLAAVCSVIVAVGAVLGVRVQFEDR